MIGLKAETDNNCAARPSPRPRPLAWPFMAPLPPPRPSMPPVSKMRMSEIFSIGLTASASAFGMMLMRASVRS